MKIAIIFLAFIINVNFVKASQVFKCADGARTFSVQKSNDGYYFAFYKDLSINPKRYECEQTRTGNNYKCTLGNSTVIVKRAYSGLMMVEVDMDASQALYCEN